MNYSWYQQKTLWPNITYILPESFLLIFFLFRYCYLDCLSHTILRASPNCTTSCFFRFHCSTQTNTCYCWVRYNIANLYYIIRNLLFLCNNSLLFQDFSIVSSQTINTLDIKQPSHPPYALYQYPHLKESPYRYELEKKLTKYNNMRQLIFNKILFL